jgi:hypothetical protein
MFIVKITKKAYKGIDKMPGKLDENIYHCHLAYKWVACWKHEKSTIIIEVYYAGSRENAPY